MAASSFVRVSNVIIRNLTIRDTRMPDDDPGDDGYDYDAIQMDTANRIWTDNVTARITIHHNWFRNTKTRSPSVDNVAYGHLYNNYLQNVGFGSHVRGSSKTVIENSYFDGVRDPYYVTGSAELAQRGNTVINSYGPPAG
ncbi:hypothetical protein DMH04_26560 [Kibdelosporangium aridum]|uniref:Pectate lyase domain-containing protein n=1 Tax=Kibdelosporangium aridum TaxID=2030 RepID=A0A428Z525_KIBAR|nr:right-handed parallel beta-helix repeat-containing protein [Kibdelosporangium aridum]RSM81912.1 hypothetical protein DMH04_26560 [Kibdelosporangium aridum]